MIWALLCIYVKAMNWTSPEEKIWLVEEDLAAGWDQARSSVDYTNEWRFQKITEMNQDSEKLY